jgi:hypothetical protein
MSDAHLVTVVALILACASFILYLVEAICALRAKPVESAKKAAQQAAQALVQKPPSIDDLTKLIEALAKLTDSLSKAGPALTSLIASVLFLAIAAISSGALR